MMQQVPRDAEIARLSVQERSALYVELTKPRITAMVLLTVAIGFWLAPSTVATSPVVLLHALLGAGLACSRAGALNQYIERETDGVMDRTRFRPLPAHKVSPATVLSLGSALAIGGVSYLTYMTNTLTAAACAATLISYLFVYTPMKRRSPASTLVGAIPGALPPVMGWTARQGQLDAGALVLFAVLFLWQIPHFLAIGRMYRDDYASGGFPMLVVIDDGGRTTGWEMVVYALALIPCSLATSFIGLTGALYFWIALIAGVAYTAASWWAATAGDVASARRLLLTSVLYLPVLFAAMFLDGLFS
jgi:protoheme IX farnesyltransferase